MDVRRQQYSDKSEYFGEWNSEGHRHGHGHVKYGDGVDYRGQLETGWQKGHGIMTIPDSTLFHRYEGQFDEGHFHGFGVFTRSDGMKYEGEFTRGNITGNGLITFKDGSNGVPRYEGQFKEGELVGQCNSSEHVKKAKEASVKAKEAAETAKEVADRARSG